MDRNTRIGDKYYCRQCGEFIIEDANAAPGGFSCYKCLPDYEGDSIKAAEKRGAMNMIQVISETISYSDQIRQQEEDYIKRCFAEWEKLK